MGAETFKPDNAGADSTGVDTDVGPLGRNGLSPNGLSDHQIWMAGERWA